MTKSIIRVLATALSIVAVCPAFVCAKAVSDKAERVVSAVLHADRADLSLVEKGSVNKEVAVYKAKSGGFAILSASDNRLIAYSEEGDFDPENLAPALRDLLSDYSKNRAVRLRTAQYTPKLLPTASYHQIPPYNSAIKNDGLVGCVGTALAIIMKYHQWPDNGIGVKEYFYYDAEYNEITCSYDYSAPFDWANTLDKYEENGQYTDAQLNAIATLSYASAVAAETMFDSDSSMALMSDVVPTLWNNLYYDVASYSWFRHYSEPDIWESSIRAQIDENLPVLYGGGAHAFVVDGYDENGLFHINWGWGGAANGYFDLDMLVPYPDQNYSQLESAVMWIRPRRDKKIPRITIEASYSTLFSGNIISNRERVLKNQKVRLSNFNVKCYNTHGDLTMGVALCDKNSNIREIVKTDELSESTLQTFENGFQGLLEPTFSIDAEPGDYLSIYYKFDDMEDWEPVDTRAHIENRCPAYGYEVSRVAVSWTNEELFDIRLLWDSDHDNFAINDTWGAIISPKDKNSIFNVKINGTTDPDGVIIDKKDDEILINVNSTTGFRGDVLDIELISIPRTETINTSITISGLDAGTLKTRVTDILEPRLITNLIVKGVMNAGDFDFIRNEMLSLRSLDMSGVSVKGEGIILDDFISEKAFSNMWTLESVLLPSSVRGMYSKAFFKTGIREISIPSDATVFDGEIFCWCNNLKKVTVAQNTPPSCVNGAIFSQNISEATLIVPLGAKEAYAGNIYWNGFGSIIEDGTVVDAVDDVYVEPAISVALINGCVKSAESCRVYDCLGAFIGEGTDVTLPGRGVFLVVCNGAVKKIAF